MMLSKRVPPVWSSLIAIMLVGVGGGLARADVIDDIIAQVSHDNYVHYLEDLLYTHYGDSKGLPPWDGEHDLCRDNIFDLFEFYGLDPFLHPFDYEGTTYHNVVAVKEGVTHPDDIFVCGAHFDTVDQSPGADDNASGVAAVLEAARILSQYDFASTIIFVAFDREEQYMIGSQAFVADYYDQNILGAICLDMIAYNSTGNDELLVRAWRVDSPFHNFVFDTMDTYSGLNVIKTYGGYSDHWSFGVAKIDDCGLHEMDENPYYHSPDDTVDLPGYLDYDFAIKTTRGFVAALALLAEVIDPADINGDGVVDVLDLIQLLGEWGPCPPPPADCPADVNFDGTVDVLDLLALLAAWS